MNDDDGPTYIIHPLPVDGSTGEKIVRKCNTRDDSGSCKVQGCDSRVNMSGQCRRSLHLSFGGLGAYYPSEKKEKLDVLNHHAICMYLLSTFEPCEKLS